MICSEVLSLIRKGSNKKVQLILKYNYFKSVDESKSSLLHYAALYKNEEVLRYLVSKGYNVNAQDSTGVTPLIVALQKQHLKSIKTLLAAGADITILNNQSKGALHTLFEEYIFSPELGELLFPKLREKFSNTEERAKILLEANCHVYQAAYMSDAKVIEYMLEQGLPVDSTHPLFKLSALHVAVSLEDIDTVKVLLKHGANINALDVNGSTPLNCIYGYKKEHTSEKIELLKILLDTEETSSVLCNAKGLFQISPTLMFGNREAIRVVLQSNIDFAAKDHNTEGSILHQLAINTEAGVVEELKLCGHKFDVNVLDALGRNPLHVAAVHNNLNMIQFLLNQGARSNCPDIQNGSTPLYIAYSTFEPNYGNQFDQCIEVLLQYGADPQCITSDENTEPMTIFDAAAKTNCLNEMEPVIAHLAVLEKLGTEITKITSSKINSSLLLKKYFDRCKKLIRRKICGPVTLFNLLTDDNKKMIRYCSKKKLLLKLKHLSYKKNLKSYSYYHNTIRKRFSKAIQRKRFVEETAGIICEMYENNIDKTHLVINKIINYLDDKSTARLCIA